MTTDLHDCDPLFEDEPTTHVLGRHIQTLGGLIDGQ
jgi:hypothetical protein